MNISRRKFVKNSGALVIATPIAASSINSCTMDPKFGPLEVHIFSKHLQFLSVKQAGEIAGEIGFAGLDLTIRPKGHILPENVTSDLSRAIQDIKQSGSTCKMITTAVSNVSNPLDKEVIKAAAAEGVQYYRSNWFKFKNDRSLEDSLAYYKEVVRRLGDFNKEHDIIGCYQNHSGTKVGASVWEVKKILESANLKYFGTQYDIRHAVAEGGQSWPNGIQLLKDHIKTIVLKDFKWVKIDGKWKIVNVPIGEGMVDFDAYFKLLKSYKLKPPVSLHLEYPLGGAEKGRFEITVDRKIVYEAMKKDLAAIHKLWKEA